MTGRSATELLQGTRERGGSGPSLSNVQRLGQIERRQNCAAFGNVSNYSEIHCSRSERDGAAIVADQPMPTHNFIAAVRGDIPAQRAGSGQAELCRAIEIDHILGHSADGTRVCRVVRDDSAIS